MTLRKNAPRARSRWLALTIALTAATALVAGAAFALVSGPVQPGGFEIEGNMHHDAGTYDWQNAGGANAPTTCSSLGSPGSAGPLGVLGLYCVNDKPTGTGDNSLSGHEQDATVQAVCGSIPNNKSDLTNFYVASQSVTVAGSVLPHSILYLGWTRTTTGGSADMDFEFNQATQDSNLALSTCPGGNGTTIQVNSHRTKGDMLVEYQFGGNVIAVKLAKWITNNATDGACATSQSAPCWGTETDLTAASEAQAAINDSSTPGVIAGGCPIGSNKTDNGCILNELSGGNLLTDTFGEAAIDLTAALQGSGCTTFGSAYLKSRSSAVLTDAVKDYIAPVPVNVTNCVTPTVTTQLSAASADYGTSVTDTATVSGFLGSNPPGGTVTFKVYSGSDSTACVAANQVGSDIAGSALAASGSNATSTATITNGTGLQPGSYEVKAFYSGDGGANLAGSSNCGDEPLTINKVQPSIGTSASPTGNQTVGVQITVGDTATFGGTVSGVAPTGSVNFTLYSDGSCTTSTGISGSGAITGSGPYTASFSHSFTPTAIGTYTWGVSYAGDSHYNPIPSSGTGVQCGGSNETLTVVKATPSLSTQIHLDDKVTITGGDSPTGDVTFQLYANNTCSGSAVAAFNNVGIVSGVASTVGLTPSSGSTFVSSGNTYSWKVTYNGDGLNNVVTVGCTVANHEEAAISYAGQ
jgi:hypothetical protein